MTRKRLSVEQWRDAILLAADGLDGASRIEHQDPSDPDATRRTIYSDSSRLKLNPMLALFDYPDPNAHSSGRAETTTASQKLFLMNSQFMVEQAGRIAERIQTRTDAEVQAGDKSPNSGFATTDDLIERAFRALYARSPMDSERVAAREFLERASLRDLVHALMVSNEMFLLD